MAVSIRHAEEPDADCVIRLYKQFHQYFRELSPDEVITEHLTPDIYRRDGFGLNPAFRGLIAEEDGEPVGYMLYFLGYDSENAVRTMILTDLFVSEKNRGRGIGLEFLKYAKTICIESDVKEMVWSVYKPNRSARRFYDKLGAKPIDDEDYMYIMVEKLNV